MATLATDYECRLDWRTLEHEDSIGENKANINEEIEPSLNIENMARQELTVNGLKLYQDEDGTYWLHLGQNAAFCLEKYRHLGNRH